MEEAYALVEGLLHHAAVFVRLAVFGVEVAAVVAAPGPVAVAAAASTTPDYTSASSAGLHD